MGTLRALFFASGKPLTRIDYDSFGNILADKLPELKIPIGFAGGLIDHDTGLVRFGYRDYDPATGRFTCPDPLGEVFEPLRASRANLYSCDSRWRIFKPYG